MTTAMGITRLDYDVISGLFVIINDDDKNVAKKWSYVRWANYSDDDVNHVEKKWSYVSQ